MATIAVATAAGWLSYWHMAATVSQHGERGGSQYVWPFTVDGLMTIAAIALVELGARLRVLEMEQERAEQPRVAPEQPRVTPEVVQQAQQVVQAEVVRLPAPVSPAPRVAPEVDRTPITRREVRSPLTGRVLTERPPLK